MCGIAGFVNFDGRPVSASLLKKATDAISHRGPDGEGQWIDDNVGLGHRRLSIIDLSSAGQQPMISNDNRYVLTYNGEIYNFRELRAELQAKGAKFRSQTDSEVVLNAFALWGNDALLKFNGMYALALYDRQTKKLLLARDRYGIKPLYYAQQGCCFSFGSEQRAITANPDFKQKLNRAALFEYFTFQNIFSDKTLIDTIHILPAGHFLEINVISGQMQRRKYWDYKFIEPDHRVDEREYIEELERLFSQAVNRQLVSDVEIGSYLSGGMDSGSITAIASRNIENLKTFTCGFDLSSASGLEMAYDERVKAEAMSALFKTEHYEMVLKAGDMERCLPDVAHHLEEPRVGQSYPNYYVARLASKFVKVVLSGAGGDELFGGYPWRYYRGVNVRNFDDYVDQYYGFWQRLASDAELKSLFAPLWHEVSDLDTRTVFRNVFLDHDIELTRPEDYINHSLYFEAKTFLHGLFVVEDKLSMASSLETRLPFMDNEVVDFAMACPVNLKLNQLKKVTKFDVNIAGRQRAAYLEKSNDGKRILRNMMASFLPDEIIQAPKQGFSSPDASWFKGDSIDFVREELLDDSAPINNLLDKSTIRKMVGEHLDGQKNRRLLVWSLLNVNEILGQSELAP